MSDRDAPTTKGDIGSRDANGSLVLRQPSPQQMLFALEYLLDHNATRAYRKVYGAKNDNVAAAAGARLLRNVKVAPYIQRALEKTTDAAEVTVERVLAEIKRMAWVDIGEAYDEDGSLKALKDMPEDVRRAIVAIEIDEIWDWEGSGEDRHRVQIGITRKVKFADKRGSNELLGKYLKMFVERHEFGLTDDLLEKLQQGERRVANAR
jgi:phage terminase small subunit